MVVGGGDEVMVGSALRFISVIDRFTCNTPSNRKQRQCALATSIFLSNLVCLLTWLQVLSAACFHFSLFISAQRNMPGAGRGRGKGNKAGGAPRIAGKRHKWTKEEYIVLFLLHTQYGLASGKNVKDEKVKQSRRATVDKIFCHISKGLRTRLTKTVERSCCGRHSMIGGKLASLLCGN